MIELQINNIPAILPDGFSMELIYENPYFTKSSNYSLEVELPMPANYHIFGSLHRPQGKKERITLPAMLYYKGIKLVAGSASILSVENLMCKVQVIAVVEEVSLLVCMG